ncbi:HesA/MoeB/ThiF family protein [Nonomuraea gerenzanensis]|uniref:Sulfur carrier protein adenylyltransferase ThiF n=1 Tax=Nonomuraea gerenzanensis TaxID=93944 RepID=A0A1M4EQT7_9ACTN|nr:ThiF family adenylyltransferase [Nonomuraea gerenzanensis]UBU12629.1 ThiF family adenylyltransferase [Nonomuraea gerenzanensis]SBP01184.1 Sulfur carrier protein adenylyltransferase ThiF [Nonomuraea gerenzanensis]
MADTASRPRLRDSVIVQADGGTLLFLCLADRTVKRFTCDEFVKAVVVLLDGTRTIEEIGALTCGGAAGAGARVAEVVQILEHERLLSRVAAPEPEFRLLGVARAEFYDRQLRLFQDFCDEGWARETSGAALQRRLAGSTAVICGIGGLGGWVALALAAAGVGRLRVCDFDRVEVSNLTRQVLFRMDDLGTPKVDAAAVRLRELNPFIEVEAVERRIGCAEDLAGVVKGADLVVNAADQPTPNDVAGWVSEACWPDIPHIMGTGYAYHIGVLGTSIIPGLTACWSCVRAETFADHGRDGMETLVGKRDKAGAMGALSGLVGNILAWEAIRILAGLPPALGDRWSEVDFWPLEIRSRPVPRRPGCPTCGG